MDQVCGEFFWGGGELKLRIPSDLEGFASFFNVGVELPPTPIEEKKKHCGFLFVFF